DVRAGGGQLGQGRGGPGHRDHPVAGVGERAGDAAPEAAAGADDHGGPTAQVGAVHGAGTVSAIAANWRSSCFSAPLRQPAATDSDAGSGKISSSSRSTPSKMARATDSAEVFGMSKPRVMSVSVGPVRTAWTLTPRAASRARREWGRLNAAAFEMA